MDPDIKFNLEKISEGEYRIVADFDIYKVVILQGRKI